MADDLKYVTDALGRSIGYRRLKLLERLRVTEVLDQSWCEKSYNVATAFIAAAARTINGEPLPEPASHGAMLANIDDLDDAGVDALRAALELDARADAEAAKAKAKN